MNIHVAGDYGFGYANWIQDAFKESVIKRDIESADLVLFTGGSDINPEIYGENKSHTTWCNDMRIELNQQYLKKQFNLEFL